MEKLIYIFGLASIMYFLINGLLPDLLGFKSFIELPRIVDGLLNIIGALSLIATLTVIIILYGAMLLEKDQIKTELKTKDIFSLISQDTKLLAPNLLPDERQLIISLIKNQIEQGIIKNSLAVIDNEEKSCQTALLLTDNPKLAAKAWEAHSDGIKTINNKTLETKYSISSSLKAIEITWD